MDQYGACSNYLGSFPSSSRVRRGLTVKKAAQEAILVGLTRRLNEKDSWSGETHLQKAAYLLRELAGVPFDFEFILYKHGPFSFQLRDLLASMQADELIESQNQTPPYGPRIFVTAVGASFEKQLVLTMSRYGSKVDWVAEKVGKRNVLELERLATALWVTRHHPEAKEERRAKTLTAIKPHVTREEALASVREIDGLLEEVSKA